MKIVDLIENGRNIPVTDDNKRDYVRLIVEHKLVTSIKEQLQHFLKGKTSTP
jgi:E3 ubiquitin-protein ligase HUWE1